MAASLIDDPTKGGATMNEQAKIIQRNIDGKSVDLRLKQLPIEQFKSGVDDAGNFYITGYANTKGNKDRYGDVPTVFPALRNYVYELKDFKKNPVLLVDHNNSVGNIAGSFSEKLGGFIVEDEIGLKFKAIFTNSEYPLVKHARTVYSEGHGRALSIGGRWFFEDKDHLERLTLAEIFEVSLVGVGADANALTEKALKLAEENGTAGNQREIDDSTIASLLSDPAKAAEIRKASELLAGLVKMIDEKNNIKEDEKCLKLKWS